MNNRIALVLTTVAVFGGGLAAGLWIGRNQVPATPPPAWLYSEFSEISTPGGRLQDIIQDRPDLWREINAELRELRPRIEAFRKQLRDIDDDFRRDFEAILSEDQRRRLVEAQRGRRLPHFSTSFKEPAAAGTPAPTPAATVAPAAGTEAKPAGTATAAPAAKPVAPATPTAPKPESQPRLFTERSDGLVSSFVFVPYTGARFADLLTLDEEQEEKLNLMLAERRTRFLRLCDDMPPPSLQLNRIADIIRRAQAEAKAGEKPKP